MERVHVEHSPAHCALCQRELAHLEGLVACAACGARHHSACRDEHGRCASCGDSSVLVPSSSRSPLVPLPGSAITVRAEGDRVVIRWPVTPQPLPAFAGAAALAWVIALVVGSVVSAALGWGDFTLAAFGAAATLALAVTLVLRSRFGAPVAPEIVLGAETIELPAIHPVLGVGFTVRCPRSEVGTVRTLRLGLRYGLVVDTGLERRRVQLEVTSSPPSSLVGEPELDWLARAIVAWRDGALGVRAPKPPKPGV